MTIIVVMTMMCPPQIVATTTYRILPSEERTRHHHDDAVLNKVVHVWECVWSSVEKVVSARGRKQPGEGSEPLPHRRWSHAGDVDCRPPVIFKISSNDGRLRRTVPKLRDLYV